MGLRLLIADPRDPYRQGLSAIFSKCSCVIEVVDAATEAELQYQLQAQTYDLVVVNQLLVADITLFPRNHFLLLTSELDMQMLFAARQYGARGYLLENAPGAVLQQILELPQGAFLTDPAASTWLAEYFAHHSILSISDEILTTREREVFHLLWSGCSRQAIARQLNITEQTVRVHANHIHEKMRLNRYQAKVLTWLTEKDLEDADE